MQAKKSLGQHFLKSEKALNTIIDAGDPNSLDIILEIGPGKGVLTERLLKLSGKVIAVEKDDGLYTSVLKKFSNEIEVGKLDLILGDILEFEPSNLKFYKDLNYKIIANIPYYLTGAILEKFLTSPYQPEAMVVLVQREVAKRIVASDNKESILSISVKAYGRPRYVETVKAGSFAPVPKVDSAILAIEGISKEFFKDFSEEEFFKLVRTGFKAKRKKLSSNLGDVFGKGEVLGAFKELYLDDNVRAEDVDIEIWQKLALKLFRT